MIVKMVLPFCCYCHRVRDEEEGWLLLPGRWDRDDEVEFRPTVCPECRVWPLPLHLEELQGK